MLDPLVARSASRLKQLSGHDRELFSRGLFPDPSRFVSRPSRLESDPYTRRINWPTEGLGIPEGSHIYTDGAGFEILWPGLRVAGWSVVLADVNGDVVSAIFGVAPLDEGPGQVARDGEDFAILMISRNALRGGASHGSHRLPRHPRLCERFAQH